MNDLWSDNISKIKIRSPRHMLEEQAANLGPKTNNLVTSSVSPMTGDDKGFAFGFFLNVSTLDNYSYRLFMIVHSMTLYPVKFYVDQAIRDDIFRDQETIIADSEEGFEILLGRILSADSTVEIVNSLIAQATPYDDIPF